MKKEQKKSHFSSSLQMMSSSFASSWCKKPPLDEKCNFFSASLLKSGSLLPWTCHFPLFGCDPLACFLPGTQTRWSIFQSNLEVALKNWSNKSVEVPAHCFVLFTVLLSFMSFRTGCWLELLLSSDWLCDVWCSRKLSAKKTPTRAWCRPSETKASACT